GAGRRRAVGSQADAPARRALMLHVIPGRPIGPGPESITTNRDYGFRAPRFARPRNDVIAIACALLLALLISPAFAQPSPREADAPTRIEIPARPILAFDPRESQRTQFGPLTFRGGLSLSSSHQHFGGISAIRVAADGARFLGISDKGRWLTGRIVY